MRINKRMAQPVVTISPNANALDALNLLHQNSIRHLPVLDGNDFVGFISEPDLRQVLLLPGGNNMKVYEIMNREPLTISPDENLEEAAKLIYRHKVDGIPVVEDGRLVGIITVSDILAAFIEIMGVLQASSRIDIVPGKTPNAFEEISRIIKQQGGDIISVGMGQVPDSKEKFHSFRLKKCDLHPIIDSLVQQGYEVVSSIE